MIPNLLAIISLVARTLLERVPFLTIAQVERLASELLPAELDRHRRRKRLDGELMQLVKDGRLQRRNAILYPSPLVGERPLYVWNRGDPPPPFKELAITHRARLPKAGPYRESKLFFASRTTSDLIGGRYPWFNIEILSERLFKEAAERQNQQRVGMLQLDHFDAVEFTGHFVNEFISCHLNMGHAYLNFLARDPSSADGWRACVCLPRKAEDDYPHATRLTGAGTIGVFFGGGLGPRLSQKIHEKLAASGYAGYEDW